MSAPSIPVAVLGGSGYVAGELLRLLHFHRRFEAISVLSTTQAGELVGNAFEHLSGTPAASLHFDDEAALADRLQRGEVQALFAATPHGSTAQLLDRLLATAESSGRDVRAVDLSADFRFPDAAQYEQVYARPHGAPSRIPQFVCAVPEHYTGVPPRHATQPGCFTTAVTMGAFPFFALGLVDDSLFVSAVTGSSGSGRQPGRGTHHPERRSNLVAYSPLAHRHEAEMRMLLSRARDGASADVEFVPHSGPFVRGIHATLRMTLRQAASAPELVQTVNASFGDLPFFSISEKMPRLADVVGSNRCQAGVAVRGNTLVVTSVIDNLIKGAAGGAVQWMNRLFGFPDELGLVLPGPGWY